MKELKIEVSEGYEIDEKESTFEKIVFKKSDRKPEWKDIGKISGWYVSSLSEISLARRDFDICQRNKNIFPSKEEAEACLALSQLCQWRDKYNEGWKPDWTNDAEPKWAIAVHLNVVTSEILYSTCRVLSFQTAKIRDKFLSDFRELIEIAKPLL